jgi:hypothetical protein
VQKGLRIDLAMYARAIPLLVRHPSILVMPLLAAVVDLLVTQISAVGTDALGGIGASLYQIIVQVVYGFSFGVAVIQASNAWRGRRATFDDAWEEGRRKAGGIMLATIGFGFLLYAAQYIGSLLGIGAMIALQLVAAFFLIYTIPAAAIGGLPGAAAISGSIRAVRANWLGSAILAIVFVALWVLLPMLVYTPQFVLALGPIGSEIAMAAIKALVLAYVAFPFAKQYDDVAFTRLW